MSKIVIEKQEYESGNHRTLSSTSEGELDENLCGSSGGSSCRLVPV